MASSQFLPLKPVTLQWLTEREKERESEYRLQWGYTYGHWNLNVLQCASVPECYYSLDFLSTILKMFFFLKKKTTHS